MPNIGDTLLNSINRGFASAGSFIPNLIAGIIVILVGVLLGSLVKRLVLQLIRVLKIENFLHKYGVPEVRHDFTWGIILAEIARWFIIILFLIPAAEIWGLPQITEVLNSFLLYIPNVFVAAIIAMVGLAFARLASDLVLASTRQISRDASQLIASVTRWAILVFVLLAVLTQLGVAKDLIRILFTGFVAMVAIAGGISFGLGGQESARQFLDAVKKGLSPEEKKPRK